jgi:hypothetical protein
LCIGLMALKLGQLGKYSLTILASVLEEVARKRLFSERFYDLCRTDNIISVYKRNRITNTVQTQLYLYIKQLHVSAIYIAIIRRNIEP